MSQQDSTPALCLALMLLLMLMMSSVLAVSEHEAPEDELDALAEDHTKHQNRDIFWFAFLVGGVGCVILAIR